MNSSPEHGFHVGGRPEDLFLATADYNARYRRAYPPSVVDALVARCGLDGHGRLPDAGCGTGQVFSVLARHFDNALAQSSRQPTADSRQPIADSR